MSKHGVPCATCEDHQTCVDHNVPCETCKPDWKTCEACDYDTPPEDMMPGRSICVECYHDGQSMAEYDDYDQDYGDAPFRDPGGNSALRCGELEFDCPTCGAEKVLTQADVARGYQCDTCADKAEGTYRGADY